MLKTVSLSLKNFPIAVGKIAKKTPISQEFTQRERTGIPAGTTIPVTTLHPNIRRAVNHIPPKDIFPVAN